VKIAIDLLIVVIVVLIVGGLLLLDRQDARYRQLNDLYTEALRKAETALPDNDARAVRDYEALAQQYSAMIDELYDQGEHIAMNKERRKDREAFKRASQQRPPEGP
jgi:tRNA isopentenyl-2-thiomethyl-A-37 hydroxylase MiaE